MGGGHGDPISLVEQIQCSTYVTLAAKITLEKNAVGKLWTPKCWNKAGVKDYF
jgi:hypothetical protein